MKPADRIRYAYDLIGAATDRMVEQDGRLSNRDGSAAIRLLIRAAAVSHRVSNDANSTADYLRTLADELSAAP